MNMKPGDMNSPEGPKCEIASSQSRSAPTHRARLSGEGAINQGAGDALGTSAVKIARDAIQSTIFTGDGDLNQFFGDYESLRDAYITAQSVFERVHLDRFVGRDWLIADVDAFLRDNDGGYFVLEAGAGLGKTAFLAYLVKKRGYIHHFVELAPGVDGIARGLRNLAAQLIDSWKLSPSGIGAVLPGAATRPDFLQSLLFEAARRRDEIRPDETIVLVADALDEAGTPPGQNVLGLPKVLPKGVYFIVSQRPVDVPLDVEGPRRVYRLQASDEKNLADTKVYLEHAATWKGVSRTLREATYSTEQFVETLLAKCQGIWIYLHYVVGEIERGERSPLELSTLPQGLWQYYAQYWKRWRKKNLDDWHGIHLPLLSTLAAIREDVSLEFLLTLAEVTDKLAPGLLLKEAWRPFLAVGNGPEHRYRLYHTSLREFFDGRAELAELTAQERELVGELADATRGAHERIADRYLTTWGRLEVGLPDLRDPTKRDLDKRYGLRHLAAHLEGCERVGDLNRLLCVEWHNLGVANTRSGFRRLLDYLCGRSPPRALTPVKNAWYTVHDEINDSSGYLSDVARAWQLAERLSADEVKHGRSPISVGLETRYALITASMNSLAGQTPVVLMDSLVTEEVWTPAEGLTYARHMPVPDYRAEALIVVRCHLQEETQGKVLGEALAAVGTIEGYGRQTRLLERLAFRLVERGHFEDALAAARAILHKHTRVKALAELSPHLEEPLKGEVLGEALAAARAIRDKETRAHTLTGLAPHLEEPLKGEVLGEALKAAGAIRSTSSRVEVLAELARHLEEPLKGKIIEKALTAAWAISRTSVEAREMRAYVLTGLVPHLEEPLKGKVVEEASKDAGTTWSASLGALAELTPHLEEPLKGEILGKVLTAARGIKSGSRRVEARVELARHLEEPLKGKVRREALTAARAIREEETRAQTLAKGKVRGEVLTAARAIREEETRAQTRAENVLWLAKLGDSKEALTAARAIGNSRWRAQALTGLVPYLAKPLRKGVVNEALVAARRLADEEKRARVLAELSPHLREPLLTDALAAARAIGDDERRGQALIRVALHLRESLKEEVLAEALAAAAAIEDEDRQAQALLETALWLGELDHSEGALAAARAIGNDVRRDKALVELAPRLAELGHSEEALAAARTIGSRYFGALALAGVAPHLPPRLMGKVLGEALAAIRAIGVGYERAEMLAVLAPHMAEPLKGEVLGEALASARTIGGKDRRDQVLAVLVPRLKELGHSEEALAAAREIESVYWRTRAVAGFAPYLMESQLREELEVARAIRDEDRQTLALKGLAELGYSKDVLAAARAMLGRGGSELLDWLARRLAELGSSDAALAAALAIGDEGWRAGVLAGLAPPLAKLGCSKELLAAAQAIVNENRRAQLLVEIAPWLTGLQPRELYFLNREILQILARRTRGDFLAYLRVLVPVVTSLGGEEGAIEVARAVQDVGRWWP